jgi:hypothetical protein
MKVFWSWQSDTPGKIGRHFVRDALSAAIEKLKETPQIEEPTAREARSAMHLDQDRKGIPGSPDLARVILEKIEESSVFVADVTSVGITTTQNKGTQPKKVINPNVAIELGYALHALSDRALLMVMNEHYGSRADLPFDLQSKAGPIMFNLAPDADRKTITAASQRLTSQLAEALELCIAQHIEIIRQATPFPQAEPKDGPARFRSAGEPIGIRWQDFPFLTGSGNTISLAAGPAMWFRLMPSADPGRKWAADELKQHAQDTSGLALAPLTMGNLFTLRAEDGFAWCSLATSDAGETPSVAFAFETGEVWAVDTWLLAAGSGDQLFASEIEKAFTTCLRAYARFLGGLGMTPPYHWIGGITGAKHRRLHFPPPQGQMRNHPMWQDECLSEQISTEGTYASGQTPTSALLPFFNEIFAKCGVSRPDYLPK